MSIIKNICEGSKPMVLSVLASLLDRIVARNEQREITSALLLSSASNSKGVVIVTKFCSNEIPSMSIERFLERIYKYTQCSPSAFVVAYAYIKCLILSNPSFRITLLNVHRLLISSVMLATKFLDDLHYRNDHYAKIGGMTLKEINTLEVEFLHAQRVHSSSPTNYRMQEKSMVPCHQEPCSFPAFNSFHYQMTMIIAISQHGSLCIFSRLLFTWMTLLRSLPNLDRSLMSLVWFKVVSDVLYILGQTCYEEHDLIVLANLLTIFISSSMPGRLAMYCHVASILPLKSYFSCRCILLNTSIQSKSSILVRGWQQWPCRRLHCFNS